MAPVMALGLLAGAPVQAKQITVAYFLEWPMPFEYTKVNGTFDKEMGVKVNWRSFDTGTAMSAAMASGDVQYAISQGVPPFVVATSAGQDLQAIAIAVSYSGNDNCVVRFDLEITKDNAKELEGKKVGVPIGTAADYDFQKQMQHFGVDTKTMKVVDMAPPASAAALAQGNLDMACGFGAALTRMKKYGNVLLTGPEKDALGIHIYDVISGPAQYIAEHPDLTAKFLKVMSEANKQWNSGGHKTMLPTIAKDAGMSVKATDAYMKGFRFLPVAVQLGPKWLGGDTPKLLKKVADFFVKSKSIPNARASYDQAVNADPLTQAEAMMK